jgi:hypothetical protein
MGWVETRLEGRFGVGVVVSAGDGTVAVAVVQGVRCSGGEGDTQSFEGDDDVVDSRPGSLGPHDGLVAGAGDGGGGVEHAVTEPFRFGDGEGTVEAQPLGPGHEVLSDQHELQPGVVADDVDAGQVAQPGVFGGSDGVLDVSR